MMFLLAAGIAAVLPAAVQGETSLHHGDIPYRPFSSYFNSPSGRAAPVALTARTPVIPKVKTAKIVGLVGDPALDRDSCGSARFGDRTFWTCRDTQLFYKNGSVQLDPLISSTASWTDFGPAGGPSLQAVPAGADPLHTVVLKQYGLNSKEQAFFPVTDAFCSDPDGACSDGTRYAIWPDLPPMVTKSSQLDVAAYTWIRQSHIRKDLSDVVANPATTLYRVNYSPKSHGSNVALPKVTMLNQKFWGENEISFGNYGNVIKDGIAYLYGQAKGSTALAKVPSNLVEDKSAYQYWVNGAWTKKMPAIGQDGIRITYANAGGQGTYYYSEPWQSYVWIGTGVYPVADMYITTAPAPTGPWIKPQLFYSGVNGNYSLGAYSIQAHPGLISDPKKNAIYITYTKNDLDRDDANVYSMPLVYVEWQ